MCFLVIHENNFLQMMDWLSLYPKKVLISFSFLNYGALIVRILLVDTLWCFLEACRSCDSIDEMLLT